jgi:hypothetical protein
MTVDEKALEAAIPVGSNIADAHLVRAIIEAYEAAKGGGAPSGWVMVPSEFTSPRPLPISSPSGESKEMRLAPAAPPARWEFFQDEGYFGMWCVRQTGESRFGEGFHVVSQEEARALCSALSDIRKARECDPAQGKPPSHADCNVPGWEYATTEGPRKSWQYEDEPPEGEGWERNVDKGRKGWERFDYTEEAYWRRRKAME